MEGIFTSGLLHRSEYDSVINTIWLGQQFG